MWITTTRCVRIRESISFQNARISLQRERFRRSRFFGVCIIITIRIQLDMAADGLCNGTRSERVAPHRPASPAHRRAADPGMPISRQARRERLFPTYSPLIWHRMDYATGRGASHDEKTIWLRCSLTLYRHPHPAGPTPLQRGQNRSPIVSFLAFGRFQIPFRPLRRLAYVIRTPCP